MLNLEPGAAALAPKRFERVAKGSVPVAHHHQVRRIAGSRPQRQRFSILKPFE